MRLIQIWMMKFAAKCPPGKRGRPMSKSPEDAEAAGFEVCEKETKDGRTVAYKTGRQLEKEKEAKSEKQKLRDSLGVGKRGAIPKIALEKLKKIQDDLEKLKMENSELKKNAGKKDFVVGEIAVNDIKLDPNRFQYKLNYDRSTGEIGSLEGVNKYDPNLAGIIQVWKDPENNQVYVINGHNRLSLAKRANQENIAVRFLNVKDAKEARAVGALTNIAEGKGTALDAAKFFKDTGITADDLAQKGIPLKETVAKSGIALTKLDGGLFRQVIDGDISVSFGTIVGNGNLTQNQQYKIFGLIQKKEKQGKKIDDGMVSELVDFVKTTQTNTKQTEDLFGAFEEEEDNILDRMSLQSQIQRKLAREKRIFGTIGKEKNAKELATVGNTINVEASAQRAKMAAESISLFNIMKNAKGEIANMLNDATKKMKNVSKQKRDSIMDDVYEKILAELPKAAGLKQ